MQTAFDLTVDLNRWTISSGGQSPVLVRRRVAEVAHLLIRRAPNMVTADQLIANLYGTNEPRQPEDGLRVYISAARKVLRQLGFDVLNQYGSGYRLINLADGKK
jgi:DNA-binding response OmpR family regulator